MKSFPAIFTAEKDRKQGAAPFYILECPFPSTGTIYIADYAVTTTSWKGGITTKAWVATWGQIIEDIGDEMALTKVSTFSLDIIIDPNASSDFETILETAANNVEVTDCKLYLAFRDLLGTIEATDPPQLIWVGNITDWEKIDELTMRLEMVDRSVRLDKYIGTKLNAADYPSAHPDDIGKMMNIVYGANNMVAGLRADWGAMTSLKNGIDAVETSLELSDASKLPSSGSVWIDQERIAYSSKTGNVLNPLTRGYNSTTATLHTAGAQVREYKAQYDSIVASHALKAVTTIYIEIEGMFCRVDSGISAVVSGGKQLLRATEQMLIAPASAEMSVDDSGHAHSLTATETEVEGDGCSHYTEYAGSWTWTGDDEDTYDGSESTSLKAVNSGSQKGKAHIVVTFPEYTGPTPQAVYARVTHNSNTPAYDPAWNGPYVGGVGKLSTGGGKVTEDVYLGIEVPESIELFAMHDYESGFSYTVSFELFEVELIVSANATQSAITNIAINGGIIYTKFVERFVALVDGYADDGSGTITGTANALIERPDHVAKHFLNTYALWPLADFYSNAATEFGSTYKFSAVLNEYKKLKKWLAQIAWESRCYFRFAPARAELLLRPDSLSSAKTIIASMIAENDDHRTSIRKRRSRLEDVINKISLHYDKDATKTGDDAYRGLVEDTDATSIGHYGEKEKPELFYFDFVQSATMADDLLAFYLARLKDRKKVVEAKLFLDNAELEFADAITLAPLSNLLCEVQQANLYPGSAAQMRNDTITVIAKEY